MDIGRGWLQWDRYEIDWLGWFVFKFAFPVDQAMVGEIVVYAIFCQAVAAFLPCLDMGLPESSLFANDLFSVSGLHDMPPRRFGVSSYGIGMECEEGDY